MKKLFFLSLIATAFIAGTVAAGIGFGLPRAVKNQVKHLDDKVVDRKAATSTITATPTAMFTATATAIVSPTATPSLVSISIAPADESIVAGNVQPFTATGHYSDSSSSNITTGVTWNSSDEPVAIINSSGLASAESVGTTTITAVSGSITGSTTLTVTINVNAPGAFTLTNPVDGNAIASTLPSFQWNYSSNADSYTFELATSAAFGINDVINQSGLTSPFYTPTTALDIGVIYYWRVTAHNSSGATIASNAPFWLSVPIPAGSNPNYVAITPNGLKAFVTNNNNPGTVTVISLTDHTIQDTIPVGNFPAGIAITSDGSKAVVVAGNGGTITIINVSNNTVANTFSSLYVADTLYDVAITPDSTTAVFGGISSGGTQYGLDIMDIATGGITFVNFLPYNGPFGVAVTPDGNSVFTTNGILGSSIKTMAMGSHALTTITNTSSTFGVAVTSDSATALVTSGEGDTVKVISTASSTVTTTIACESNQSCHNIAITPDNQTAVVVGDFNVALISVATNLVVKTYPNGGANVAITPDSKLAFITGGSGSSIIKVIKIK